MNGKIKEEARERRNTFTERKGFGPRRRFITLRPPSPASVATPALGEGLGPLWRRARGVGIDRTVQSLVGHLLTQYRMVVLSNADTRHRLTPQEIVASVPLADGELKGRHLRLELCHLNQPSADIKPVARVGGAGTPAYPHSTCRARRAACAPGTGAGDYSNGALIGAPSAAIEGV